MSQEKTSVPGLSDPYSSNAKRDPYARTSTPDNHRSNLGTVVPGMEQMAPGVKTNEPGNGNGSPVVGFLYSISRQGIGEYWPVHIGSNKIGRAAQCDIRLKESTVSDIHAELNVKQMKTTRKVLASIKDVGSKNGIFVNDEELGYSAHECFNSDLITIGLNYKLLLVLIDAEGLGLSVSKDFIAVEEEEEEQAMPFSPQGPGSGFNPYDHNNRVRNNGTVAMDGSQDTTPGKTRFM